MEFKSSNCCMSLTHECLCLCHDHDIINRAKGLPLWCLPGGRVPGKNAQHQPEIVRRNRQHWKKSPLHPACRGGQQLLGKKANRFESHHMEAACALLWTALKSSTQHTQIMHLRVQFNGIEVKGPHSRRVSTFRSIALHLSGRKVKDLPVY